MSNAFSTPGDTAGPVTPGGGIGGRVSHAFAALFSRDQGGSDRLNALIAFAVRVTSAAILFLSQILLARWIGVTEYGLYVYAWTLVLVTGAISTVGLNIGAIRIVSELRETGAVDALRGFLRASRLVVFAVSSLAAALVIAAAGVLAKASPASAWPIVAIILLAVPAYALTDLQDGISRGWARMTTALVAPYILRPVFVLAGVGGMVLLGLDLGARQAALAAVAATWTAWAIQTAVLARDRVSIVTPGARAYRMRAWSTTSAPLLLLGIFDLAMQNIDVIVISNLLTPADAGIYFAGAKTMALMLFVQYAVGSALSNRFAAISTRGDAAALREAVARATRWTFWPCLVIAAVMLLAGQWLLSLFGPRFVDGFPVMVILAVGIIARAAIGPAEAILNMTGSQRECARALMIAALANLILCIVLTPRFGIIGTAFAVASAMMLGAFLNWRAARRCLGFDIGIWAAWR